MILNYIRKTAARGPCARLEMVSKILVVEFPDSENNDIQMYFIFSTRKWNLPARLCVRQLFRQISTSGK